MYPYQPYHPYHLEWDYLYRQQDKVNRIYHAFIQENGELLNELQTIGMDEQMISYIVWTVIQSTLTSAGQHSGTINNRTNAIYNTMQTQIPWLTYLFRAYRLSDNQKKRIVRTIIRFTLQQNR